MKYFSYFTSFRNISDRFLHLHLGPNQLRLNNMFSARSQLLGMGLQIATHLKRSLISKTALTRKLGCSYFSTKADFDGDIIVPVQQRGVSEHRIPERVVDLGKEKYTPAHLQMNINDDRNPVALLYKLMSLTKATVRDPNALQNICTRLLNNDLHMNVKESIHLLFCLSVLNVHDEALLMKVLKLINELLGQIYKPTPFILSISKSMRNLQVRNTELLNGLMDWLQTRNEGLALPVAADLIQTLAIVNYFPANADILLKEILVNDMTEYTSSINYLNFVWAVTLIDRLTPELAESVMVPSFRKKLESVLVPGIRNTVYFKLINIHAYATLRKFKIKMESNWYGTENTLLNGIKEKRLRDAAIRNFIDCLANIMPIRTFTTFVDSDSGCVIDAVCFFDNDHRPVTELESVKNKNGIKLAILFLMYKDLCLPGKSIPSGIIEFHKRYLESSNYKVLYVPFNEFVTNDSLKKKSAYMKRKIRSVLPKYEITK